MSDQYLMFVDLQTYTTTFIWCKKKLENEAEKIPNK